MPGNPGTQISTIDAQSDYGARMAGDAMCFVAHRLFALRYEAPNEPLAARAQRQTQGFRFRLDVRGSLL